MCRRSYAKIDISVLNFEEHKLTEEQKENMRIHARLSLFLFILCWIFHVGKFDLASDGTALLALKSAVGGSNLNWNETQTSPCTWRGVVCRNDRVTALLLPGVGLVGGIPTGVLGNLTSLHSLTLRLNSLTGQLPSDLALCTELRSLYLQDNQLSGSIPNGLFQLSNLVRLNLGGNNFSGRILPLFNNLTQLRTLYLDRNQLVGSIPELRLPSLSQFNVSFNQLNGSIPSSLRAMRAEAFRGNKLCGAPLDPC